MRESSNNKGNSANKGTSVSTGTQTEESDFQEVQEIHSTTRRTLSTTFRTTPASLIVGGTKAGKISEKSKL